MSKNIRRWLKRNNELIVVRAIQLSLFFFVLGFNELANFFIIICTFLVLVSQSIADLKSSFTSKWFYLFISYFLLTLLGVSYSSDVGEGLKYVEMRLLMVLLPFVFISTSISFSNLKKILFVFIYALALGLVIGLVNSFFNFWTTSDSGYFYNDNLVVLISKQATYYSIYLNIAIVFILFLWKSVGKKHRLVLASTVLPLYILGQLLLAVRISLFTLMLFGAIIIVYALFSNSVRLAVTLFLLSALMVCSVLFFFPQTFNRFISMTKNLEYQFDNPNPVNHFNGEITAQNWNGLNLRLAIWHCGIDIIKENKFFGVGTGDYKSNMRKQYNSKNFIYAIERDFGVHNQFLYTTITFGVFGSVIFILWLIASFREALANQNYFYVAFIVVMVISFLTESALNRYIGIYIFSLFSNLLFFRPKPIN